MTRLHWTAGLHHDGSAQYVSNPLPHLNEEVTIRLRVPVDVTIRSIALRSHPDGEDHFDLMRIATEHETHLIYEAPLKVKMPHNTYRFRITTAEGVFFYTANGVSRADLPDWYDFKLLADFQPIPWLEDRVFYQIFPDRFHNGDPTNDVQDGEWEVNGQPTRQRAWGDSPLTYAQGKSLDFFGGDLVGIQHKIDYLTELGINAIYLTPIFTSASNHRYNMRDFYQVDPHLGGNQALIDLRRALHAAEMRLALDMTPNHSGSDHPWFTSAQASAEADSAEYYTFYERPDHYEMWLGVRTLPKFNYTSQKLRDQMYRLPDSILQFWLREPYAIDSWRLDVYNMTARQGAHQLNIEVGREMRQALKAEFPDRYIFGENFFDGTYQLQGDQLDGLMNYRGFNIPLWHWLAIEDELASWMPDAANKLPMPTEVFLEQIRAFRAAIPWVIARQQFNQLGSHDTSRILNIIGEDHAIARLAFTLLATYPGVPCVYYGDEIGMLGKRDPDNRRTMIWDETQWDMDMLTHYRRVIALRKSAPALLHGGYQDIYGAGGVWAFQRQSPEQQLIIIGYRDRQALAEVAIPMWSAGIADGAILTDLLSGRQFTVHAGHLTLTDLQPGDGLILEVK